MSKFKSFDGKDNQGVRAEVSVMVGTGRIKELIEKGRNVEIVFDPDNPMLKKRVSGFLEKQSTELWEYAQKAFAEKRDISYRIESQRKRNVDRTIPFENLKHADDVVRIVAALDKVFSLEALTNPKEDPSDNSPSALYEDQADPSKQASAGQLQNVDPAKVLSALALARSQSLSEVVIDTLVAQALASGANLDEVMKAGFESDDSQAQIPNITNSRVVAQEEKPWVIFNSDGRPNAGSYMVTQAAKAEQFALDHLVNLYSLGKKSNVDVSDKMIAQAAAGALELLKIADSVQSFVTGGRANRQKNSYGRALDLVFDAVAKRYPMPLGENEQELATWNKKIVEEASERLYGVMEVAHGRLPLSTSEREPKEPTVEPEKVEKVLVEEVKRVVEDKAEVEEVKVAPSGNIASAAAALGGKIVSTTPAEPAKVELATQEQIARVKALCEKAGVTAHIPKIVEWLGKTLGVKAARLAETQALETWLAKYESKNPSEIFEEVVNG